MTERLPLLPPSIQGLEYQSPLGRGGFADVFLYRQNSPSRQLAVKVFIKKLKSNTDEVSFMTEANKLAKFSNHPNIVTLIEAKVSRDGYPYLAMEYCPSSLGKTWRTNPLSVEDVLDYGVQIACALEMVHRADVVHRDIKPANILISELGAPKLSDFGIAGNVGVADGSDQVAMSLPWSAPEVVSLQSTGTKASDIWSLGATLYSLLAGRSPFEAADSKLNTTDQLTKRIRRAVYVPIPRAGIPSMVEAVLSKAMAPDPTKRWGSMQEFAMALNEAQVALRFPATRITIPSVQTAAPKADVPRYPCGHEKVNTEGLGGVVVGNVRGRSTDTEDPEVCPICKGAEFVPAKKKFKFGPMFWIFVGAVTLGFVVTAMLLRTSGV